MEILAASDPQTVLIDALIRTGGPFALILVAAIFGLIYFKPHVQQLSDTLEKTRADLKEAREEIREAREQHQRDAEIMREILVPAVTQSTMTIQRMTEELYRIRGAA